MVKNILWVKPNQIDLEYSDSNRYKEVHHKEAFTSQEIPDLASLHEVNHVDQEEILKESENHQWKPNFLIFKRMPLKTNYNDEGRNLSNVDLEVMDVLWDKLKEISLLYEFATISRSFLKGLEFAAPAEYYKEH